jgi:hypothetical protein
VELDCGGGMDSGVAGKMKVGMMVLLDGINGVNSKTEKSKKKTKIK